jgi:DNA-binding NtrC family response regulator
MLEFARTILEKDGFVVVTAGSAPEALELYHARGDSIDALVTDVVMPGMDGVALAGELSKQRPDLPVIYISGYVSSPALKEKRTRSFAFLRKPFTPAKLTSTLKEVLGQP